MILLSNEVTINSIVIILSLPIGLIRIRWCFFVITIFFYLDIKGKIKLSLNNIIASTMDIKGELALSTELKESLGFLLSQFDQKDNFYQIQISGPFRAPQIGSKR